MRLAKRNAIPAPGNYDIVDTTKVKTLIMKNTERLSYMEEACFIG